jgi:SAM-dependent methyltransferase
MINESRGTRQRIETASITQRGFSDMISSFLNKLVRFQRRSAQQAVSLQAVEWAYRLFLDREPENRAVVVERATRHNNTMELRQEFMNSDEFRRKQADVRFAALTGQSPGMFIEQIHSDAELQILFEHIQKVWQHLGEEEPYWSVLSTDNFKLANIRDTKDSFFDSGRGAVEQLFSTLERNKVDFSSFETCLDYGCGVGRLVRWLSERFEHAYGFDISRTHLQIARDYLDRDGIQNVTLHHIERMSDVRNLPKVDLIYSVIVLQHNPPPVISFIIREFIRALNPRGVALFQVTTFRSGYRFSMPEYLSTEAKRGRIEMHVLPQSEIFKIAREQGGTVIEVLEDSWAGFRYDQISNTFLIQKE